MAIKKKVVKEKTQLDYFKSIDLSLKTLNDFLQGEFFEKIESLDWKIWEMHQKMEKNDKVIEILEDLKSLLRVHLMNDGSQSSSVEEVSGKPTSIVGKLFKSKK
jgi:predicted component of type VI protein secretion system